VSHRAELISVLARTATPGVAQGHHQWWRRWRDAVASAPEEFRPPEPDERDAGDRAGVNRVLVSAGGVRVGARLIEPEHAPRAGVVLLHGYGAAGPLDDRSPWTKAGLATLKLRVRGFEGSTLDAGDLSVKDGGWIAQGLEDAERSALIGAVADVILAVRALREHLGDAPVGLRGDSLGGGLAVIAAANALDDAPVHRLAVGLPSLGDWTLRLLSDDLLGAASDAARAIDRAAPESQGLLRRTLRLADAATHARRVSCPALCLLAADDPVVPPASAAAIYNALGSDPGMKGRVLVERGHQDAPKEDLRRVVAFERLATRFLDPAKNALTLLGESSRL